MDTTGTKYWAIVPAAGTGSRVGADIPKQYISIHHKTILEHTLGKLLDCKLFSGMVVAISSEDNYFQDLPLSKHKDITTVYGGADRCDSVLAALDYLTTITDGNDWVLVHDAARPCVSINDIHSMVEQLRQHPVGGILGIPVRDTMKRLSNNEIAESGILEIEKTECRENMWHALTPQMFRIEILHKALIHCRNQNLVVTDESSAIEQSGMKPVIIEGSASNIKVTQADDLQLAEFYLKQQEQESKNEF